MSNEANKNQAERFAEGQVIFRLRWGRLEKVKVLKVTPKKVVIQEATPSYQKTLLPGERIGKASPDPDYDGATWHVIGYDLNALFPNELAAKRDELARVDALVENTLNDLAKYRNEQVRLNQEIDQMTRAQDLGGFTPNG